jgi:hypothetical protein
MCMLRPIRTMMGVWGEPVREGMAAGATMLVPLGA